MAYWPPWLPYDVIVGGGWSDYRVLAACGHCGLALWTPAIEHVFQELLDRGLIGRAEHNSGYRCPTHNARVGGAPLSYHLLGMALDIGIGSAARRRDIVATLTLIPPRTYIIEYDWGLHIDVRTPATESWRRLWRQWILEGKEDGCL